MIRFGAIAVGLLASLVLSSCHPSDQKVKTVKERLDDGDTVVFSEPGFRYKGCSSRAPDWSDMRLNDNSERARVVVGKQGSILSPGIRTCYRIGSRIPMTVAGVSGVGAGLVQIDQIAWARIDKLNKYSLKGRFFASSEEFNRYVDGLKPRMRPEHQGLVSIVSFTYVSGSAVDEKTIIDQDGKAATGDGYEETAKDGDSLSRCKNQWSDLVVNKSFHAPILNRELRSWFDLGSRNCFKQGAVAAIKEKIGDGPAIASVKIAKIKRFRYSALDAKFFSLHGLDWSDLKAQIQLENSTKNEEFMTVIDFEVQQ